MDKRSGQYVGTYIDGKWWKPYTGERLYTGGDGEYWYDEDAFYFLRYLPQDLLTIPLEKVSEVRVGRWHCGNWALGSRVVRLFWRHDGRRLISGFVLSHRGTGAQEFVDFIRERLPSAVPESGA